MIDEEKQDLVIADLLGLLEASASQGLKADMDADRELAGLADELRESMGALASAVPQHRPPPELRAKVLASAHGEKAAPVAPVLRPTTVKPFQLPDWLPWAVAAGIALATVIQFADSERARSGAAHFAAEAAARRQEADRLRERNAALESEAKLLASEATRLQQELETWQKRDALAEVRIATLKAQVTALSNAGAVIVWDADQQRGIVKFSGMPAAGAGKDYQLWVIDGKYPDPVSAGVVTVGNDGAGYASFTPTQPVTTPSKFAISIERSGGSPTPTKVVLIGD